MSTTKLFTPAGVKISTTFLAHVGEQSIDQNLDNLVQTPTGDWAPSFVGAKGYAPEITVETFDITKALDLMSVNVLCADLSAVNVDVYQRSVQANAMAYDTDESQHQVYRLTNDSMLCWEKISVNQQDEVKISLKLIVKDNGSNEPLLYVDDQTIEDAGEQNAPFTLGPIECITDGGATAIVITGVKSFTWNNNPEMIKESADGDESPGFIALKSVRPVLQFETTDLGVLQDNFCATDQKGIALDRVRVFFRKRRPSNINYADSDAVHVKLESDAAAGTGSPIATLRWTKISGDPAKAAVEIHLHRANADALFSYTKNTAISTGTGTTTTTSTTTTTTTTGS